MLKFRLFAHDPFFSHFNLGVLEKAHFEMFSFSSLFLKQNHMLSWHMIHLNESISPLFFNLDLTNQLRSVQTKLESYKILSLLVQELVACILLAVFLSFSFICPPLPVWLSVMFTHSTHCPSPAGRGPCCFPLALQLAWPCISGTQIPEYSCHSPEPSPGQNPIPSVHQIHPD